MNISPEHKGFIYIFIFFAAFYFMLSSGHFYATDEAVVFQTTKSLITRGELDIPIELIPTKGVGGKYYCYKGIALSILAVPYYISGAMLEKFLPSKYIEMLGRKKNGNVLDLFTGDIKIFTMVQVNIHLSALLCALFYLLSLRLGFSMKTSIVSAFFLGIATLICTYSKFFHNQTLGCLALLAGAYFILSKSNNLNLLLAGTGLGLSLLTRLEYACVIPVFVYYILSNEEGSLFTLRDKVPGSSLGHKIPGLSSLTMRFTFDKKAVMNTVIFLAPVILAIVLSGFVNYLMFGVLVKEGIWISGNILQGLYGNLFSVGRSIFIFSPPLILSMFYMKRFFLINRKKAAFIVVLSVVLILSYSKLAYWHATWSWGNRYLFIIVPFLMLPLGYMIEEVLAKKKIWQSIVIAFFFLTGFFVQLLGMTPYMWDICYNYNWTKIESNIGDFYEYFVFVPNVSPLVVHWEVFFGGKYVDYWFYHIFKNYGIVWVMFFAALPLLGIILSLRGILKIMKTSVQNTGAFDRE